jgi:DNA-binding NarL/FixJ family response regulator
MLGNLSEINKAVIRAVLIDDHPLVRAGIKNFFDRTAHIQVVGESDNGLDAIDIVHETQPDIVLVDIEMPKMGGIDFTIWLRKNYPKIKIIILSSYDDDAYIVATLKAGANGYLLKNSPPQDLIQTVENVVANKSALDPGITHKIVSLVTESSGPYSDQHPSRRELEILQYVAQGKTNIEIGKALHISSRTVQGHLSKVFSKLDVYSRTEAVTKAATLKLLSLEALNGR